MGLASHYRRFIRNFAKIAEPLHVLLRKSAKFDWSEHCQQAFENEKLRTTLTEAPVLKYPIYQKEFIITTDASGHGLGAVLSQLDGKNVESPVSYISRALTTPERNYTTTEQEALVVIWAIKCFRHYVLGNKFEIITDHASLKWLMTTDHKSQRLTRWGLSLQEYDFSVEHKKGKLKASADALSPLVAPAVVSDPDTQSDDLHNKLIQNIQIVKIQIVKIVVQIVKSSSSF